jgi:hypothetical protein
MTDPDLVLYAVDAWQPEYLQNGDALITAIDGDGQLITVLVVCVPDPREAAA